MDLKYGLKVAPWDQAPHSMDELLKILQGFKFATNSPVHTVILWVEMGQLGPVRALLESQDAGYTNVQALFWYKPDMNVVGPVYKRTPAVEVCLIALKGRVGDFGPQFNLSKDPVQRHNHIMGPSKRVLTKRIGGDGEPINIHEKPDWLAEALLSQYTRPGQWIVVGGFGAGGDVRGALNAGLNVVAVENDPDQFHATVAHMRNFVPDSNVGSVYTHDHLVFGYKNMAFHQEEEEEPAHSPRVCLTCKLVYEGAPVICGQCGIGGCASCFVGTPPICKPCRNPRQAAEALEERVVAPILQPEVIGEIPAKTD